MSMRLHDRMVLRLFLQVLVFCILAFAIIYVLADVFERIDGFMDNQARVSSIVRYYLYQLADIVRQTLPVDVLLATLFTLGVMGKNNEIVALLASGVSTLRVARPILVMAILATVVSGVLSEVIVPTTNARLERIKRVEIEKHPPIDAPVRYDFNYRGHGGYIYHVRTLNVQNKTLKGVTISLTRDGRVVMRLDAASGVWTQGLWEFHDGFFRTFGPESSQIPDAAEKPGALSDHPASEKAEAFQVMRLPDLQETPDDLARIEPKPEEMNFRQLRQYVQRVRLSGGKVNDWLVDLYAKSSDPFTVLVLAVLGVGLSARKRKTSLAAGFGLTLVIGFSFLVLSEIGAALGKNENLPPVLAAWMCQILFGAAGAWFLVRANR